MKKNKYDQNAIEVLHKVYLPFYIKHQDNSIENGVYKVNGTYEIIDAHLTFIPNNRFLDFGEARKASRKYIENETAWYHSADLNIKGHKGIEDNKIWSQIAGITGNVNSNYGYLCFSPKNGDKKRSQYDFALDQLIKTYKDGNTGRQSVIAYWRPSMQWEYNDGEHATYDMTCTFQTEHFIRDDKLIYIVTMRSNDVISGTTFDYTHHYDTYHKMLEDVKKVHPSVGIGEIRWNAGSLHLYERNFELMKKIVEEYSEIK